MRRTPVACITLFKGCWGLETHWGNCRPPLYLKWQLIKTHSDETEGWPATLIGIEADIMYVSIPPAQQMMIKPLVAFGRSPLYGNYDFGRRPASGGSLWFYFILTVGLAGRTMERSCGLSCGSEFRSDHYHPPPSRAAF